MDDVFYNSTDVAMSLRVIECSELRRRFIQTSMGRCDKKSASSCVPSFGIDFLDVLNMDPRPFLWLRITLPIVVY